MVNARESRRKARLNQIVEVLKTAKQSNTPVDEDFMIANIMYQWGVSKRVAKEDFESMKMVAGYENENVESTDDNKEGD